ncbi:MAG: cobalamin biosynthesis protein CbiM [Bacteroidetes bacterium]|jgi:cobalt/nickel transport system permease protein|nr:cobalamin biosynthesis protein CbiM [Bacteroidota bacterium]
MQKNYFTKGIAWGLCLCLLPQTGMAMHIAEGFLPPAWALSWHLIAWPFIIYSVYYLRKKSKQQLSDKLFMGLAGGFVFVLSALKLPSVAGSSSHLTGIAFGTLLVGSWPMVLIGLIVLLFQALLLAHGGLTTLGANVFSMAIAAPFVSYGLFLLMQKLRVKLPVNIFITAFLGDLITYVVTSGQLALAFPDGSGASGYALSFGKFAGMFAVTQLPLAVVEGILTTITLQYLIRRNTLPQDSLIAKYLRKA